MTTRQEGDAPITDQDPQVELSDDPDEIRVQIEETRADLGDTVEALAAKADVKAQVKNKLADVRDKIGAATPGQARGAIGSVPERVKGRPVPVVFAAGLLLGWLIGRRR